jgi:hypothetical protein
MCSKVGERRIAIRRMEDLQLCHIWNSTVLCLSLYLLSELFVASTTSESALEGVISKRKGISSFLKLSYSVSQPYLKPCLIIIITSIQLQIRLLWIHPTPELSDGINPRRQMHNASIATEVCEVSALNLLLWSKLFRGLFYHFFRPFFRGWCLDRIFLRLWITFSWHST